MISHLKSIGGSPFISGDSWDPSKFNLADIFLADPSSALYILLNYKFEGFKLPLSNELPPSYTGLKKMDLWGSAYDGDDYVDTREMLEEVNNVFLLDSVKKQLVTSQIAQGINRIMEFRSVSYN